MKRLAFFLQAVLLLWAAGSCSDKDAEAGGSGLNESVAAAGKGYLALNILTEESGGPSVSGRAWSEDELPRPEDFDPGSADESELCSTPGSHWVMLFNGDGSYHSMTELTRMMPATPSPGSDAEANKEKVIGTFIAEVKIEDEANLPAECLVVLNARPARIDQLKGQLAGSPSTWTLPDGSSAEGKTAAEYVLLSLTRTLSSADIREGGSSVVLFRPGNSTGENAKDYCTMSSSTYTEGGSDGVGPVRTLEAISPGLFAETPEAAQANPLEVHVERLAAKVEVSVPEPVESEVEAYGADGWNEESDGPAWPVVFYPKAGEDGVTGDLPLEKPGEDGAYQAESVKWACTLWGWGVNALERREYLFKNLNDGINGADKAKTEAPHYKDEDNSVGSMFFANWNDTARHRSYWAVDGYYADANQYPMQYRHAYDDEGKGYVEKFPDVDETTKLSDGSPLYYYSYRELRRRALGLSPEGDDAKVNGNLLGSRKFRYIPENVIGAELLEGKTYLGASTHVLFMAQLLLGDEIDTAKLKYNNKDLTLEDKMSWVSDKYYAGGYWYDEEGYMKRAYAEVRNALNGEERTFKDYFGGGGDITTPAGSDIKLYAKKGDIKTELTDTLMFKLAEEDKLHGDDNPFEFAPADVSNGDGQVLLSLKEGWTVLIDGNGNGEADNGDLTLSRDQFKSVVFGAVGAADLYKNGRMYYYTPIRHARATSEIAPGSYAVGDIGVVRNHWYKIAVNSVLKPGVPVSDPEQPIIPNIDPKEQYLGLDIHIVPWHVVDQSVDLK